MTASTKQDTVAPTVATAPSTKTPQWQAREPVELDVVQYRALCEQSLAELSAQPIGGAAVATGRDGPQDSPGSGGGRESTWSGLAVQARGGAEGPGVRAAAARGIEGAGGGLPHLDRIQQAFGPHDVSGVQAHVGGPAAEAASAMGAQAYAAGDHVAFAAPPDLHLAAHEAAHVVQQRGGVQLKGGVGQVGDAYEQHADRVADAVVAGESAAPILGELAGGGGDSGGGRTSADGGGGHASGGGGGQARASTALVQRDQTPATVAAAAKPTALGLFERGGTVPAELLATVHVVAARLPPELATLLTIEPTVSVDLHLALQGTTLAIVVAAAGEVLIAKVSLERALAILGGPVVGQLADKLPTLPDFAASAAGRFKALAGSRVKVQLWGADADASFVVIDLANALRSAWRGDVSGLRPIEAHLQTAAGRLDQFADEEVKAATALPTDGQLGELDVAAPGLRKNVLGLDDDKPVHAIVYYRPGVQRLAIALLAEAGAKTGVVAELNLQFFVDKLSKLGEKAKSLASAMLEKLKAGATKVLDWASGALKFDLGEGNFFAFDFHLLLPKLGGGGGGFDLGALWPSTWSFDLGGLKLGALPKLSVPWLSWPKLGNPFNIDLSGVGNIFSKLGFPDLPRPSVPFDLHFQGLDLGFALDLGKLWPDLDWGKDGPSTFGLNLDLQALLQKLADGASVVGKAASWLLEKLKGAGAGLKRWVHPGTDGVIRFFDGNAGAHGETSMLGFSLRRLLDGADATDLVPVEMRYHGKDATLDLGQAVPEGTAAADAAKDRPDGAAVPKRPANPLADQHDVPVPARAVEALGLATGATGYVAVAGEGGTLVVYAQAKSGHRDGDEALRLSVDVERLTAPIAKRIAASGSGGGGGGHGARAPKPVPHLGGTHIGDDAALEIKLGEPSTDPRKQVPYARAAWRISALLGATDLTALMPQELTVQAPGLAGVSLGAFTEPEGKIGRVEVEAASVRKHVLGVDDDRHEIYLGAYYASNVVSLTATPTEEGNEGLLGHVDVVALLGQLKRLGAMGEKVVDAIGSALGAGADKIAGFAAKIAAIAAKIGRGALDFMGKIMRIKLGAGNSDSQWIGWDLSRLTSHISLSGFSLDGLIPDFSGLKMPGLPGLSLSWLPSNPFTIGNPLGKLSLPALDLKKLLAGLDIDLPSMPNIDFGVFGIGGLGLGISIDLPNLAGTLGDLFGGHHNLSFQIDLDTILKPFGRAWQWLKSKFPQGVKKDSQTQIALGGDGVLRLWDDEAHIGFQLKSLLDGFQPSDIVPVEMQFHVTAGGKDGKPGAEIAGLEYGQVVDEKHQAPEQQAGQTLAQRPSGKTQAHAKFPAPAVLRTQLGAPAGANLDVDLIQTGEDAAMFATVSGTDRGLVMHVKQTALAGLVQKLGPKAPPDLGGGVQILWDKSKAAHGLVIGFGPQPDKGTKQQDVKPHGHAMWRLARFFDGLDLADLVPDEARLDLAEGGVSVGMGIDVSGLHPTADISVPDSPSWLQSGLGSDRATVFANADERALRIALVAPGEDPKSRRGLELDVATWFVDSVEDKVAAMAKSASSSIGRALKKVSNAGKAVGGELTDKRISLERTHAGLRLQRGKDGERDHVYATFGWSNLVDVVTKGDVAGLVPTELRLATNSLALEIKEDELADNATMPAEAKRVGGMHAMFKDTLTTFGISEDKFLSLDLGKSPIEPLADGTHNVNLTGHIYTAKGPAPQDDHAPGVAVEHATSVTLTVSLEALLAQVLPRQRKFAKQKQPPPKPNSTRMTLGFKQDLAPDEAGDQAGIELGLSSSHTSKKTGNTRTVEVRAGWTAAKLLSILMNLDDIISEDGKPLDALGLLTPDVVSGSFSNHLFKLGVTNRGTKSGHAVRVGDLPILPDIMATFVDEKTANETIIHLELPDGPELASRFGSALLAGEFVKLGAASLEVPGAEHPFGAELALSLGFLKRLAGFIPYVGIALKIIDGVAGFAKDPKGTAESILYTPELLYHFVDNAGAIFDKLSGMSAKDMALAFMMDDSTTKQAVYAARLKKKLDKAGIKLPDGKPGGPMPSEEALAWLNQQDPAAIAKAMEIEKRLTELGLNVDEEKPDPKGKLNMAQLTTFQDAIQAGFTEFAKVRADAVQHPDDPAAQAAVAAAAEKFRKDVAARIAAGVHKLERDGEEPDVDATQLPDGAPPPDIEGDPTKLQDLPEPDADQRARAQAMFQQTKEGLDPTYESYLIQKFAFLSVAQLATMLEDGNVTVTTKTGTRVLPMFESERPFVVTLFKRVADPSGTIFKTADGMAAGATSQDLVNAWRNRNAKASDQAARDQRAAETAAAAQDAAARAARDGHGAGHGGSAGAGAGGAGAGADRAEPVEETMDEALWGAEPDDEAGSGESGQGLDTDGDGKLSGDELRGKKPGAEPDQTGDGAGGDQETGDGDHATVPGNEGGGGEPAPAEPEQVDDTRLWKPDRRDAHGWVRWNEATSTLERNDAGIQATLDRDLHKTTSKGEDATLSAIEMTPGGDVGRGGKIVSFEIVLIGKTPAGVEYRSAPYAFYHDVKADETFTPAGGALITNAIHNAFEIKDGKPVLRGGKQLVIGTNHFTIMTVFDSRKAKGGYLIPMLLAVDEVPANTKMRNDAGEWQVLNNGDRINATLPYMDESVE